MSAARLATILLSTLATIVGLIAFFLTLVAAFGTGQIAHAALYAVVFVACLVVVARVMRSDRRQRLAAEAALPPERRPRRPAARRPITFRVKETGVTFAVWAAIVAVLTSAAGQPGPVVVGAAVFAGFMLATLTVTGRHMMFRITGDDPDD